LTIIFPDRENGASETPSQWDFSRSGKSNRTGHNYPRIFPIGKIRTEPWSSSARTMRRKRRWRIGCRESLLGLIHAAGVCPTQAPPEVILRVDLYGTALVLELFGNVIARGGSEIVIASMAENRIAGLPVEQNTALAMLGPDRVTDSGHAYVISKRANALRVMAEAVRWGRRGARINSISPGIIITPLAKDETSGPLSTRYRRMIEVSAAGRAGTPDEVGHVGALLMGQDGAFIAGSDIVMDGGVTAAFWFGELAPQAS
jgi:NAD(P)-dependent dehydrogenase (short-subunit alcohol dehydrogenase family)